MLLESTVTLCTHLPFVFLDILVNVIHSNLCTSH
jgi:hypothetical protein